MGFKKNSHIEFMYMQAFNWYGNHEFSLESQDIA